RRPRPRAPTARRFRCLAPPRARLRPRSAPRLPNRPRCARRRRSAAAALCEPPPGRSRADRPPQLRDAAEEVERPRLKSDVDVDLAAQLIDEMPDRELVGERLPDPHLHVVE